MKIAVWTLNKYLSAPQIDKLREKIKGFREDKLNHIIVTNDIEVKVINCDLNEIKKENKMSKVKTTISNSTTTGTNWSLINQKMKTELAGFVNGTISGRQFYRQAQINGIGGEVRSLLRTHGVDYARRLGKKALSRRS